MKAKLSILSLAFAGISAMVASPALASTMVAGWDFSQYAFDNFLSLDGATLSDTLDANHSDLLGSADPGPAAAGFGTMYLTGQFGSTDTPLDFATDPFVASAAAPGSLSSNISAPAGPNFDDVGALTLGGQGIINPFTMTATALAIPVFEADLGSVPEIGSNWTISFAGKTNTGSDSLGIEFSTDGVNFTSFGSVILTTLDTLFSVTLGTGSTDNAYVRFSFDPDTAGGQQAFLDNVAFSADLALPEPTTAVMLLTGLAGLIRAGYRRT
jgi:hypothetical protein